MNDSILPTEVAWCTGKKLKELGRTPAHEHPASDFYYDKNGKRYPHCIPCHKIFNKLCVNGVAGKKKAKYDTDPSSPTYGMKWCYKQGVFGGHWEYPDKFGTDQQWDDGKAARCDPCSAGYWQSRQDKSRRSDPRYSVWEKAVKERDGGCVLCGSKEYLHAHHLNGYNWYEEGQYDVDNGVTLCSTHHNDFHEHYGKGDNTRQQWEEYKQWYEDLTNSQ